MIFRSLGRCLLSSAIAVSLVSAQPATTLAQGACTSPKDGFLNPFTNNSAHHRPIGTGAEYASSSHPATRDWLKARSFTVNHGSGPFGLNMTTASSGDPVLTVGVRPGTPGSQLPANVRFPRGGLHIDYPGGRDGNVAIFDRQSNRFQHIRNYGWNNGRPYGSQYRVYDARSLGHGTSIGRRVGTSASGVASPFGILRGFEVGSPGYKIEHALQIVLPRLPGCNIMLSRDIILPATSRDGSAGSAANNTGNIPYGGLLALPPSVNINGLGLSEPGRRLAEAIRNYGIYAVDGGGCTQGAIRADQTLSSQVVSQLKNDIPKIYPHIRLVLNSEWRPNQTIVGGGKPLAPNCAFDAGARANVATPHVPSSNQSSGSQSAGNKSTGNGGSGSSSSAGGTADRQQAQASVPSQPQSSGGKVPQPGSAAGESWAKAVRFYEWAMLSVPTMQRYNPGTPQHDKAKANYDRNMRNYIAFAAKAGVKVDANTPPSAAGSSSAKTSTKSAAPASKKASQAQSTKTQSAQRGSPTTSQAQSSAGNQEPTPGTAAAKNWAKAVRFYNWAMLSVPTMQRYQPGTPQHSEASANYQRNMGNYIAHAAKAGVKVSADVSPDEAFG